MASFGEVNAQSKNAYFLDDPDDEFGKDGGNGKDPNSTKTIKRMHNINARDGRDLYGILELERACEEKQIKKQYRKLSLLMHPDRNQHPEAVKAFTRIGTAYHILGDPEKRANYDRTDRENYKEPVVDVKAQYGEEFAENAFDEGDESDTAPSDDESGTANPQYIPNPNREIREIYRKATPFIKALLENPPMTKEDKKKAKQKIEEFNNEIKIQNINDKLEGKEIFRFQIQYTIFESNGGLAKPFLDRLNNNPQDVNAKEKLKRLNDGLATTIKENGYNDNWCFKDFLNKIENGNGGPPGNGDTLMSGLGNNPKPEETVVEWKPGYTLTGDQIIAMLPLERTIRQMVNGVPEKIKYVYGYRFIVKDVETNLIEIMSGASIGRRAQNGYLSLPADQIIDARYSEERYSEDDLPYFIKVIDFASNPFNTRSSNEPRFPNGYALVMFKDGEHVLSRTALRGVLGKTDADYEIQQCEKQNGRVPTWKFQPLEWRPPRSLTIESPTKRRLRMQSARLLTTDDVRDENPSETESIFVPERSQPTPRRTMNDVSPKSGFGRRNIVSKHGKTPSTSTTDMTEMTVMKNEMAELRAMLNKLMLAQM